MRYAIFSQATGRILRVVTCSESDAELQLQGGDALMPMPSGDDSTHYVAEGEFISIPVQPSSNHIFDYTTKQWVDPRTLQDLKATKWSEIKAAREDEINSNLVTPYGAFDADTKARANITDSILMLQTLASQEQYPPIDFTLADNSTVSLGVVEMVNVGLLLGQKVQTAHGKSRALRILIDAATSAAELEGIVWTP